MVSAKLLPLVLLAYANAAFAKEPPKLEASSLDGPFASLEAVCQAPGVVCDLDGGPPLKPIDDFPAKNGTPFTALARVNLKASAKDDPQHVVAFRTGDKWWTFAVDAVDTERPGFFELAPLPSGSRLLIGYTSGHHSHYVGDSSSGVFICGVGKSGTPSCTATFEIGSTDEDYGNVDHDRPASTTVLLDCHVELRPHDLLVVRPGRGKDDPAKCTDAERGTHRLVFP